jgi:5-formyltetrahydrofolate cyclo-ligase
MTAIAARKTLLRQEALQRRGALPSGIRNAFSARLAEQGLAIARKAGARVASAFWPIRDEPDTLPLLAALAADGLRTALPITISRADPLVFRQWRAGDAMQPGAMKIPEPLASAEALDPDLLFVPLACFDRRGHRIGYGAGHYDRTLTLLRAARPTIAVGIAYGAAETAEIPDEAHDQRLDFVLTEHELIDCRSD